MAESRGIKLDEDKLPLHLVPPELIYAVSGRLQIGSKKYGDRNWEKGIAYSKCYAAVLRHLFAWWEGQDCDPDAEGSLHLDAALTNLTFLVTYTKRGYVGLDDRPDSSPRLGCG